MNEQELLIAALKQVDAAFVEVRRCCADPMYINGSTRDLVDKRTSLRIAIDRVFKMKEAVTCVKMGEKC